MEFNELFEDTLKDVYYAEKLILRRLPKLAKSVTSDALSDAFQEHTEQTKGQVERLEQIFEIMGKKAKGKRCAAMEGLMAEADELMEESEESVVRDAGLLACAQAVEHYEIARYGTLKAWAQKLGHEDIVKLLDETLQEEKETDKKLTGLAESEINLEAEQEEDDEDEEEKHQGKAKQKAKAKMQDEDEEEDEQPKPVKAAPAKKPAAKSGSKSKSSM